MSSAALDPSPPKFQQPEATVSRALSDCLDRDGRLLTGSGCRPSPVAAAGAVQRPTEEQQAVDTLQRGEKRTVHDSPPDSQARSSKRARPMTAGPDASQALSPGQGAKHSSSSERMESRPSDADFAMPAMPALPSKLTPGANLSQQHSSSSAWTATRSDGLKRSSSIYRVYSNAFAEGSNSTGSLRSNSFAASNLPSQGSWTRMNSVTQAKPASSQLPESRSVPLQAVSGAAAAAAEPGTGTHEQPVLMREPDKSLTAEALRLPGLVGSRRLHDPLLAKAELIAARLLPPGATAMEWQVCVEKLLVSMRRQDAPEGAQAVAQRDGPLGRAPGPLEWQHSSTSPRHEDLLALHAHQTEAVRQQQASMPEEALAVHTCMPLAGRHPATWNPPLSRPQLSGPVTLFRGHSISSDTPHQHLQQATHHSALPHHLPRQASLSRRPSNRLETVHSGQEMRPLHPGERQMQLLQQLAAAGVADPLLLQQVAAALLAAQSGQPPRMAVQALGTHPACPKHHPSSTRNPWAAPQFPGPPGFPAASHIPQMGAHPFGPQAGGHPLAENTPHWPHALLGPNPSAHFQHTQNQAMAHTCMGHDTSPPTAHLHRAAAAAATAAPHSHQHPHSSGSDRRTASLEGVPLPTTPAGSVTPLQPPPTALQSAARPGFSIAGASPTRHSPTIHTVAVPTGALPEPCNPFQSAVHQPLPPVSNSEGSLGQGGSSHRLQSQSHSVLQSDLAGSCNPLPTCKSEVVSGLSGLQANPRAHPQLQPPTALQVGISISMQAPPPSMPMQAPPTLVQSAPTPAQKPWPPHSAAEPLSPPTAAEQARTSCSPGPATSEAGVGGLPGGLGPDQASVTPMTSLQRKVKYIVPPAQSFEEAAARALPRALGHWEGAPRGSEEAAGGARALPRSISNAEGGVRKQRGHLPLLSQASAPDRLPGVGELHGIAHPSELRQPATSDKLREAAEMLMALKPTSPGNNSSDRPGSRHASSETQTDSSGSGACRQASSRAHPGSRTKSPPLALPAMKQTKRPKTRSPPKRPEYPTAVERAFNTPHASSKRSTV